MFGFGKACTAGNDRALLPLWTSAYIPRWSAPGPNPCTPSAPPPFCTAAPREEDKAAPFSYIGFGGGRHGCMGSQFAYLQIKTIWSVLLRNFTFELVDEFPEPDWDSMVIGPKPTRVRYTRRKL